MLHLKADFTRLDAAAEAIKNILESFVLVSPPTKERRKERWFILNNAAITRIDFDARGTWLVYMNRADFLPRELIT